MTAAEIAILETVVAMIILALSSDLIVDGAVRIATRLGLPKVVVGVVILGYASGLPELTASGIASYNNLGGVALGSVIGSNTINATLVIGVGALIAPFVVESRLIARESIIAMVGTLIFAGIALVGMSFIEALGELVMFVVVTIMLVSGSKRIEDRELQAETESVEESTSNARFTSRINPIALLVVGLSMMLIGAQILISGVQGLISQFHIQQGVAGALILATGATFPELLNSIAAARRRESEILAGNVLGEIIFNSSIVGGFAGLFHPGTLTTKIIAGPLPIMVGAVALVTILLATGKRISRAKAIVLITIYIGAVATITFA